MNPLRMLSVLVGLACFAQAAADKAVGPKVVILLTDDQGTLEANCYGSKDLIAPNIDNLAAKDGLSNLIEYALGKDPKVSRDPFSNSIEPPCNEIRRMLFALYCASLRPQNRLMPVPSGPR